MNQTVATPRKWGWMLFDLAGVAAIALGALAVFAPESAAGIGMPLSWGWPLIVVGGVAMLLAMMMFFRQLRASRAG